MDMNLTLKTILVICIVAWMNQGCSGCNDTPPSADTDTDTDTDTDSDTDTYTDTDSDTYHDIDWGDPLPCENDPLPEEVCVPGGKYVMGCVPGDVECEDNEKPMVEVNLSPFFMNRREVTNEQLIPFLNTLREGYVRGAGMLITDEEDFKVIWSVPVGGPPIHLNKERSCWSNQEG